MRGLTRVLQHRVVCQIKYQPGLPVGIERMAFHDVVRQLLSLSGERPALQMNDGSISWSPSIERSHSHDGDAWVQLGLISEVGDLSLYS